MDYSGTEEAKKAMNIAALLGRPRKNRPTEPSDIEVKLQYKAAGGILPTQEPSPPTHITEENLSRVAQIHTKLTIYNPQQFATDFIFLFTLVNNLLDDLTNVLEDNLLLKKKLEGMVLDLVKRTIHPQESTTDMRLIPPGRCF